MAEFAQLRLEESIPELRRLEALELLDKNEIVHVIKKRKIHEYKIQRSLKCKDDFLKYITYEMNLLTLIKIRQRRVRENWNEFKLVQKSICKRVQQLFKQAVLRFPADVKLWLSFIEFCRRAKYKDSISSVYASMLKIHNNKPDLFIAAAKWEWEEKKLAHMARAILLKGVRFIPKSKLLYTELFRVELLISQIERQEHKEAVASGNAKPDAMETDPILSGKIAEAIYRNAISAIRDVDYYLLIIHICQDFDFTGFLQDKVYADLEKAFPNDERSRAAIAIRPMNRAKDPDASIILLEKQCLSNFESAVKAVPTQKMWSMYIEFCRNRLKVERSPASKDRIVSHLLDVFSRAASALLLAPKQFIEWANLVSCHTPEDCAGILLMATMRYPQDAYLWMERINHALKCEAPSKQSISKLFEKALAVEYTDTQDSLSLWKLAIRWNALENADNLDAVIERGMKMAPEVAKSAKLFRLQRAAFEGGLEAARKVYNSTFNTPPGSLEFYNTMLDIEEAAPVPDINLMRSVMEQACDSFGKRKVDLWLRCMKIERRYGDVVQNRAALVYSRAVKRLTPKLADQFIALQSLANNKIREVSKS